MMRSLWLGVVLCPLLSLAAPDNAKVTVLAIDADTLEPCSNVAVVASFQIDNGTKTRAPRPMVKEGVTDATGRHVFTGFTNLGVVHCELATPLAGYYPVRKLQLRYSGSMDDSRWLSDDLVATIRLQRVVNPIPLRVRQESAEFDGEHPLQYDFLIGDWLPPQGKGEVADVEFSHDDWDVLIRFPHQGDGIMEVSSGLQDGIRLRQAPESGYSDRLLRKDAPVDYLRTFCFRIRTRLDESGKSIGGYFGKIYGDIQPKVKNGTFILPCKLCGLSFLYYFNPTENDRNLEWNTIDNLYPSSPKSSVRLP